MNYPDITLNATTPAEATVRKALKPLVKQYVTDTLLTEMAKTSGQLNDQLAKNSSDSKSSQASLTKDINKLADDIGILASQVKTLKNTDLSDLIKRADAIIASNLSTAKSLTKLSDDHQAELTKAFQLIFGQLVKAQPPLTDKKDASDYLNVRLTDGQDFYKAIDKYMTAISDGGVIPFQDESGKAARPLVSGGALHTAAPDYASRVADDSSAVDVTYVGQALPGTATSAAGWQIQKIDSTTGTVVSWADGDANYNNVWDDREGLSYS